MCPNFLSEYSIKFKVVLYIIIILLIQTIKLKFFLRSCVLSPTNDTSTCKKEYQATIGQSQVTDSVILDRNFVVWDFSQRKDTSVASFSTDKRSFQYKAQDQFVVDSDNSYINLTSISEETPYIDRNTAAKEITGM